MAAAPVVRGHGDEAYLAGAVHKIRATPTDVHRDTAASELRDRITPVQWLRVELAAVEMLLTASCRRRVATADAASGPDRTS